MNRRYEKVSIIVTLNKSFTDWGEKFSDPVNILDVVVCQYISMKYR
ncbi:ATP-binding protein [Lonsdalea quercina]